MHLTKQDISSGILLYLVKQILFLAAVAVVLFAAAGSITWVPAWVYLAALVCIVLANTLAMDPHLMIERSKLQKGTKQWDILLSSFVAIWGPLMVWITAGMDARHGWSQFDSLPIQSAGFTLFILGSLGATWAMKANKHFSSTVRIQEDRKHQVAATGPYRYVRHPGYLGGITAIVCTPVALGSWIALIPGIIVSSGFILRTYLEDRVLQEELPGYREYMQQVSYRLIPKVW